MGQTQVYDMVCELIEYSNQRFNTGRTNIDSYFADYNTDIIVDWNSCAVALLFRAERNELQRNNTCHLASIEKNVKVAVLNLSQPRSRPAAMQRYSGA